MTTTIRPPAPTMDNTTYALWIDVDAVARRVWEDVALTGGATVCTTTPSAPTPTAGYAVALAGMEEQHSPRGFSVNVVADYVRRHIDATTLPGIHVGAWWDHDTDMIFLDLSAVHGDRAGALDVAREAEQLAVWDLANAVEIRL